LGRERPFATALRHAWLALVSGLDHEKLIRRHSNTSAIPRYLPKGQAAMPVLCQRPFGVPGRHDRHRQKRTWRVGAVRRASCM